MTGFRIALFEAIRDKSITGKHLALKPLKQFGQHFLTDTGIADNIVQAAEIELNEPVWEIGPGKGILTERILELTSNLTAFEIDFRLKDFLVSKFGNSLNLVNRDILAINWQELLNQSAQGSNRKLKLVSNLPYQITSPVMYAIEKHEQYFSRIVMMIQKEVADRLTAKAGTKAYGVLTLKLRYFFDIKLLFNVQPEAFTPPPKVHSAVVMLTPRECKPNPKSLDTYRQIIDKAFAHRRKTLRNNLRVMFDKEKLIKLESLSGIDFNRRGETIEEDEYVRLADCAFDLNSH